MTRRLLAICCAAITMAASPEGQQPRDAQPRAVSGPAAITGVVLSADADALPLRRVRVLLSGTELDLSRSTITGDDGTFGFQALPAGRYTLSAAKDGYVTMALGAPRPGRPGRSIVLGAGEVRQVRVPLPRGAVITGVLRDPHGEPAAGFPIVLLSRARSLTTGEHVLRIVAGANITTDDRGVYRVFGLPAGSYVVAAMPRGPGVQGDIATVTRDEVQRALAEVQERRTSSRPGMPAPGPPPAPVPTRSAGLSLAPTYYPGTTLEEGASMVTVAAGEVRTGIDFDVDYVPTASVSGSVAVPPGARVQLLLSKADPDTPYQTTAFASPDAEGRFMFRRIQPGHYVIHARSSQMAAAAGAPAHRTALWGRTEVVMAGDDIEGVSVTLEPALNLSGEVVFDGAEGGAPSLPEALRVPFPITAQSNAASPFPAAEVEGSRVVVRGVVPGVYAFRAAPRGIRTRVGGWWLKSILLDDREVLDRPLEILPNTKNVRVAFSNRASQLTGLVTDRTGAPVTDSYVVVFSEDTKTWFQHSRRVAGIGLNAEGRYTVWNLPPGDYFVAVSADLENNEWFDADRLTELRASASRVTIAENQSVRRDITVNLRQP